MKLDTLAAKRAQRVAIKETTKYLRGRSRESVVGEIMAGIASAHRPTSDVPVYESETAALRGELARSDGSARPDASRVIVLMCHEEREEVFAMLAETQAALRDSQTAARETAGVVGDYAERAVLIPVGAALFARDRVVSSVSDTL